MSEMSFSAQLPPDQRRAGNDRHASRLDIGRGGAGRPVQAHPERTRQVGLFPAGFPLDAELAGNVPPGQPGLTVETRRVVGDGCPGSRRQHHRVAFLLGQPVVRRRRERQGARSEADGRGKCRAVVGGLVVPRHRTDSRLEGVALRVLGDDAHAGQPVAVPVRPGVEALRNSRRLLLLLERHLPQVADEHLRRCVRRQRCRSRDGQQEGQRRTTRQRMQSA